MVSGTSDRKGRTPSKIKLYPYQASLHSPGKQHSQEATLGKCSKLATLNLELLSKENISKGKKGRDKTNRSQVNSVPTFRVSSKVCPLSHPVCKLQSKCTVGLPNITFKWYVGRSSESNNSIIFIRKVLLHKATSLTNKTAFTKTFINQKSTSQVGWCNTAIR